MQRTAAYIRRHRKLHPGRRIIAIALIEHLGDIVACEPVIRYVRGQRPGHTILWVVRPMYTQLLQGHPQLDGCIEVLSLTEAMMLVDSGLFDEVLNLHVNWRRCPWLGTLLEKRSGDPSITIDNYYDHGSLLEAFSRAAGLPGLREAPQFTITQELTREVRRLLPSSPFLVLHGVTNDKLRDWSTARWAEFVDGIKSGSSLGLVEIGHRAVVSKPGNGVVNLCGQLSLQQSAALIREAAGFVGVDSGPAHLANALRKKSLILMGKYLQWARYMPYTGFLSDNAPEMLLRWDGPVAEIQPDACLARARMLWAEYFRTGAALVDDVTSAASGSPPPRFGTS